jgi:hypothetical protein
VLLALLPLLAAGAGIGLHVEEQEDVSPDTTALILQSLSQRIFTRTGTRAVVDDLYWSACTAEDRCIDAIRARTRTDHLVMIRAFGGPRDVHLVLERLSTRASAHHEARLTLDANDHDTWELAIGRAVVDLFPEAAIEQSQHALTPAPDPLPWALLGAGVVSAGVGAAFGVGSANAKDRIEHQLLDEQSYDTLSRRQRRYGTAADVLFAAAIGSVLAGATLLLTD